MSGIDLSGEVAIVTGGGMGGAMTLELALLGSIERHHQLPIRGTAVGYVVAAGPSRGRGPCVRRLARPGDPGRAAGHFVRVCA